MTRIHAHGSVLVVIDMQQKLLPVIHGADSLLRSVQFLMNAAEILQVPAVVTEQYPRGLGATVPELSAHPVIADRLEKLRFSAARELAECPVIAGHSPTPAIILTGIETHVCVQQTALELTERGCRTVVCVDGCSSRYELDHAAGLQRMRASGVTVTSVESLVFEWCESAGTDHFRRLSRLVRDRQR